MSIHLVVGTPVELGQFIIAALINRFELADVKFKMLRVGTDIVNIVATGSPETLTGLNDELYFQAGFYYCKGVSSGLSTSEK